jgi:hypothetical protein
MKNIMDRDDRWCMNVYYECTNRNDNISVKDPDIVCIV